MDMISDVISEVVSSDQGVIELSLACHADGAYSVVAWRRADGQRVGYLHHPRWPVAAPTTVVDPSVGELDLLAVMQALLAQHAPQRPDRPPIGRQLVDAGQLSPEQRDDLLGWQWLLTEVGEARPLGELAQTVLDAAAVRPRAVQPAVPIAARPPAQPAL